MGFILIILAIVVGGALFLKMEKMLASGANGGAHGENFPFPNESPFEAIDIDEETFVEGKGFIPVQKSTGYKSIDIPNELSPSNKGDSNDLTQLDLTANQNTNSGNTRAREIVADFDMERAVVYAEILNPKYKEY